MFTVRNLFEASEKYYDEIIELEGWIKNIRASKNVAFIELNDGTNFKPVQVVVGRDVEGFEEISDLHLYSGIKVRGKFIQTPGAKQPFEIQAEDVEVLKGSHEDYPLQKKAHSNEFLREIAHLRPRSNTFNAVFRVRSLLAQAIHKFFSEKDFIYVNTPIITGSDAEGAGEMFDVSTLDYDSLPRDTDGNIDYKEDFFGKKAHLTVSGQLQLEAFALAFRNVYTFGPTFRAENSNTTRHAAEFWMMEPEIAFADLNVCMDLAEEMIKYIIAYVLEEAPDEMAFFDERVEDGLIARLQNIVDSDFRRLPYTEAIDILLEADRDFENPVSWGIDLATEHERYLAEEVVKGPVFVTDYPAEIKAFYMRANEDGKTVAAMDLLVPGIGELIGGSQREEREDVLIGKIEAMGMKPEDYWWYLEILKYGGVKHAGFGLGFERMIMYVTGMGNIRDVIPFPRTVNSLEF